MRKVDRRNEMAELDDDVTDGQMADYLAADLSGDNGAWNIGLIEYQCPKCDVSVRIMNDELENYYLLIRGWHDKAAGGDYFARFVFEYLSFIAHVKNNLFYDATSDRNAIQMLKREERIQQPYLEKIASDPLLRGAWNQVIQELSERPLYNSSYDPDNPRIHDWWNCSGDSPIDADEQPKGRVLSLEDWQNMVEFWYSVRNNLFHGGKNPNIKRDMFLVEHAYITLSPLMEGEIQELYSQ